MCIVKETKTITLTLVGTGNPQTEDVNIVKGTTVEDLKRASANLKKKTEYDFVRKATGEALNKGVDIFGILEDHEKVNASPNAEMGGMRELFSRLFSSFSDRNGPSIPIAYPSYDYPSHEPAVPIVYPSHDFPSSYEPPAPIALPIEQLGLDAQLEEHGWNACSYGYEGHIPGNGNYYPAKLTKSWYGYRLFIFSPPICVFHGRHQHCFISQGGGWYFVHFITGENAPLSMIRAAERYIAESRGAL